jgi:diguanylate cyclase (GGDEF)-like protein
MSSHSDLPPDSPRQHPSSVDDPAVRDEAARLRQLSRDLLQTLSAVLDTREGAGLGHGLRVAEYAVTIGRELNLPDDELEQLHYAGVLHDLGKLLVDDRILRKKGPLIPPERAAMVQHAAQGAALLEQAGAFPALTPLLLHHHEWFGGGGYPDNLAGEAIPPGARIMAVADAFDAMTSDRPYRPALSSREAFKRLRRAAGPQFDPKVVTALERAWQAGRLTLAHRMDSPQETVPTGAPVQPLELSVLLQISRETRHLLHLQRFLLRTLEILRDQIGHTRYAVLLTEEASGDLVLAAHLGYEEPPLERIPCGRGVAGWVAKHAVPQLVDDVTADPRFLPESQEEIGSELVVPLAAGGKVIGVLALASEAKHAFRETELHLLRTVADHLATAIEAARYHEQVALAATHDGLTQVFNHAHFRRRLEEELQATVPEGRPLSVAILDLDDLKKVNDSRGHLAGDAVLRAFAALAARRVRTSDLLARYGGDEFALLMPGTTPKAAVKIVGRLAREAARQRVSLPDGALPLPTVSWGIANFPADGDRANDLVAAADRRMYRHKIKRKESAGGSPAKGKYI